MNNRSGSELDRFYRTVNFSIRVVLLFFIFFLLMSIFLMPIYHDHREASRSGAGDFNSRRIEGP